MFSRVSPGPILFPQCVYRFIVSTLYPELASPRGYGEAGGVQEKEHLSGYSEYSCVFPRVRDLSAYWTYACKRGKAVRVCVSVWAVVKGTDHIRVLRAVASSCTCVFMVLLVLLSSCS